MIDLVNVIGKGGSLIYQNPLSTSEDVKDFVLEGEAAISFPQNRMRLENKIHADEGQKANYVYWCKEEFPENVYIRFNFWPVREPGLCMLFFSGEGKDGKDIFDPSLEKRTGDYVQYHHGDINAFHVSYFRRKEESERTFHTCNLRKSYGFHLTVQGGDPIPDVIDATPPYEIAVLKYKQDVYFFINDLEIFHFSDDGKTYGPLLKGGKIGFRQLAPFIGEYADLEVYEL